MADINSALVITVYDEDRNHAFEFLGKLSLPLLNVLQRQPGRLRRRPDLPGLHWRS